MYFSIGLFQQFAWSCRCRLGYCPFLHLSSHHSGPQLQSMIPPDDEVAKSERICVGAALFGVNNQGYSGN